jgi:CubicO group peptidase (beta-lactamase class C family)
MSASGLSKPRLDRLHEWMAGYVARGEVPGMVTLVSRRGEAHVDTLGTAQRDTIFRIASMTKPVTAVAAMILVEECRLRLDDPVDRLLPELADRKVLKRLDGPVDDTVPANRAITLRDLLTFRLGFGLIMGPPDKYPILRAMAEAGIVVGPKSDSVHPPDAWIKSFGTLPLMHQPGEKWMYHSGSDVLGVLIARAAGQSLETFLRERLFEPLGMQDTGFTVPASKLGRLATAYMPNRATGALDVYDDPANSQWARPPVFPSGGAGLVSTIDDYLAFAQMMLNQGKHGRERILSRLSVQAMTSDQLTPEQKAVSGLIPGYFHNHGWGFGVGIVTQRDGTAASPGTFGWDGGLGTSWYSDPREDMTGILLTQRAWSSPSGTPVTWDFWTGAYQAIDD